MPYPPKIEGETCKDCGKALNIKNPKTGKIFCADKCWLGGNQPQTPSVTQQNAPQATQTPNVVEDTKNTIIMLGNANNFASNIYQGSGEEEKAIALSKKVFEQMRSIAKGEIEEVDISEINF